jgi:hypothetical protein
MAEREGGVVIDPPESITAPKWLSKSAKGIVVLLAVWTLKITEHRRRRAIPQSAARAGTTEAACC